MRKQKIIWVLMKCNKPVLIALLEKWLRKVLNKTDEPKMTLDDFLQNNRREIKDFLREFDCKKIFKKMLFPHDISLTKVKNWDIEHLILFLKHICGVTPSVKFYMQKTREVHFELCRMHARDCTRVEYKEYRRQLRKMRQKCYKELRDRELEEKTEEIARQAYSNGVRRYDLHVFYTKLRDSRQSSESRQKTREVHFELCRMHARDCTRAEYKEYRRQLRKMRQKCYKELRDRELEEKTEEIACQAYSNGVRRYDLPVFYSKLRDSRQSSESKGSGHNFDKIHFLLHGSSCEVMRALVKKIVNVAGCTLDSYLARYRSRIYRRACSAQLLEVLFPADRKQTNISEWNLSILSFILLNICFLDRYMADSIGDIRRVYNEQRHRPNCGLTGSEFRTHLHILENSIKQCLSFIDDPNLTRRIKSELFNIKGSGIGNGIINGRWAQSTKRKRVCYEKVNPETRPWTACITRQDKAAASQLVDQKVLPSNEELLMAFDVFGRSSETFLAICKMINRVIESKSQGINGTWTSYHASKKQIVFVVETSDKSMEIKVADYHIYIRSTRESSGEGALVMSQSCSKNKTEEEQIILENLRKCIIKHADSLMNSHSKLSVVLPSLKKSVGYESRVQHIFDEPCISLYVPVKGLIPIEEDPFPKKIDDFQVDVIEGEFVPYTGYANDFHEHLKMGLAIHGNARDKNGDILGGTLGGFVDHPVHGLCGISSAHALLSRDDLLGNQTNCRQQVSQPVGQDSEPVGEIVSVLCCAGDASSPGMEVVLFKINKRHPIDGSFPEAFNYTEAGFDDDNPPTFNSGKVLKASEINSRRKGELYKFGMSTALTRGAFACQGAVVRLEKMDGQSYGLGFSLKDQIVVLSIGNGPFADFGDSGALVFTMDEHNDSHAVGIVVGGLAGNVFVTPIHDILRALGCTDGMCQFNTSPFGICSPDSGIMTDDPDLMETNDF